MSEEGLAKLAEVFKIVFQLPPNADATHTHQDSTPAWDSLGHVMLVSAIASEFEVEISPVDSLDITSFDGAAQLLSELLAEPGR